MKIFYLVILLISVNSWSKNNKNEDNPVFDIIPLNSPVKENEARFLLKLPKGFEISKLSYVVKGPKIFLLQLGLFKETKIYQTSLGPEFRLDVSTWKSGSYRLYVKIKDKKNKDHYLKKSLRDYVTFSILKSVIVKEPDPKINNATLLGVDSDDNGIRDDVQLWITKNYSNNQDLLLAFNNYAISFQNSLKNKDNRASAIESSHKAMNDFNCVFMTMLDKGTSFHAANEQMKNFEILFLNTKERILADKILDQHFHGQITEALSKEESCEI